MFFVRIVRREPVVSKRCVLAKAFRPVVILNAPFNDFSSLVKKRKRKRKAPIARVIGVRKLVKFRSLFRLQRSCLL